MKLDDIDPQAWLTDVLGRIADHPVHLLHEPDMAAAAFVYTLARVALMLGAIYPRKSPGRILLFKVKQARR